MRYAADDFAELPRGEDYRRSQLDKAFGHVFRAAYDALDCLVICFKQRLGRALDKRSREAIVCVFPEYYDTYVDSLREIDERIINSRKSKDVGNYTVEQLDDYFKFMEKLTVICRAAETRVPDMVRYDRKKFINTVLIPIVTAIGGALLMWLLK